MPGGAVRKAECGMTWLVMPHAGWGVTATVACGAMCEFAGRTNRQMTQGTAGLAAVAATGVTAWEVLRGSAVEITCQTTYEIARRTKDHAAVPTTSQTMRGAIPRVGVPFKHEGEQRIENVRLRAASRRVLHDKNLSHCRAPATRAPASSLWCFCAAGLAAAPRRERGE
jgi:hypothetical protein